MGHTRGVWSRLAGAKWLMAVLMSVVIVAPLSTAAPAEAASPLPAAVLNLSSEQAPQTAAPAGSSFQNANNPVAPNGATPPTATLHPPAPPQSPSITGAVTAATGGAGLGGVVVDVFDRNRKLVDRASTAANGTYSVSGVTPSVSFFVCFDAGKATGGISATGYASQCYKDVAWSAGAEPPRVTTPVLVPAGATASGINASLVTGGAISGRVTAAAGGAGLKNVTIDLFDSGGRQVASGTTTFTGTYSLSSLSPATTGYTVCFDATNATGGGSNERYLSECYKSVGWSKGPSPPTGTTPVSVSSAATVFGIDLAVPSAPTVPPSPSTPPVSAPARSGISAAPAANGAISGVVTAATGGAGLDNVTVEVFDTSGNFVTSATTSNGSYTITGLPPSTTGYKVCFDATRATGGGSTTGYASQCYKNVAWNGLSLPAGTTRVAVTSGATTTGISAALVADGGISGAVTAATGGAGVDNVTVDVFDTGGNFVTSATTSNGSYAITGLPPSTTGYKVCFDATSATGGSSTTGYASQCYNNVAFSSPPPATATAVPVSSGTTASGISAALTADGGISGTVTAATGGAGLSNVTVEVADASGNFIANGTTASDGSYKIIGLSPSATGYSVCFDPAGAAGGSSTTGYASQCYNNVAWAAGCASPWHNPGNGLLGRHRLGSQRRLDIRRGDLGHRHRRRRRGRGGQRDRRVVRRQRELHHHGLHIGERDLPDYRADTVGHGLQGVLRRHQRHRREFHHRLRQPVLQQRGLQLAASGNGHRGACRLGCDRLGDQRRPDGSGRDFRAPSPPPPAGPGWPA